MNNISKKVSDFITEYAGGLGLLLALIAVVIGGYNTYQIKNMVLQPGGSQVGVPSDLSKIFKELPKNAPFLGNPNAKLVVVEFADYQCP